MTTPCEPHDLTAAAREDTGLADDRPLTYNDAEATYRGLLLTAGRDRYEELNDRELWASTAALLRDRGDFNPRNPGHQAIAARQPLTAAEHLEMMAIAEMLARYYRHPTMLDHAVKAGATWEQVGAARGTSASQARQDYREWAAGQHWLAGEYEGRFGMCDDKYPAAIARSSDPETSPGDIGDLANIGIQSGGKILCAHADRDGQGMHWKLPAENCAAADRNATL